MRLPIFSRIWLKYLDAPGYILPSNIIVDIWNRLLVMLKGDFHTTTVHIAKD